MHHFRGRKTGPCFPVAVVRCGTHRKGFTLYPPGQVPYGRVALAPVAPDGEPLAAVSAEGERAPAWSATIFGAAADARDGKAWPREHEEDTGGSDLWQTQLGRLDLAAKLLGLVSAADERLAELIAGRLGVPLLQWREASAQHQAARGYRARGRVVMELVVRVQPAPCLLDKLIGCGVLVGLFGEVRRWELCAGRPRCTLFRQPGTPSG